MAPTSRLDDRAEQEAVVTSATQKQAGTVATREGAQRRANDAPEVSAASLPDLVPAPPPQPPQPRFVREHNPPDSDTVGDTMQSAQVEGAQAALRPERSRPAASVELAPCSLRHRIRRRPRKSSTMTIVRRQWRLRQWRRGAVQRWSGPPRGTMHVQRTLVTTTTRMTERLSTADSGHPRLTPRQPARSTYTHHPIACLRDPQPALCSPIGQPHRRRDEACRPPLLDGSGRSWAR